MSDQDTYLFALSYVLENEGGYCVDSGGPTNWGITIPDVAKFRGVPEDAVTVKDMRALSRDEASRIYRKSYWTPLRLDSVKDTGVATAIFDIGVNRGISVGAKYAQKTCKLMGQPIYTDGQIGDQTITAINLCDSHDFIAHIEAMDMAGYEAIISIHPAYHIYREGWERRAKRLLTLI